MVGVEIMTIYRQHRNRNLFSISILSEFDLSSTRKAICAMLSPSDGWLASLADIMKDIGIHYDVCVWGEGEGCIPCVVAA